MQEARRPGTAVSLTHRRGSLPTLVEGLNLRLDDNTSSGYWGVEWCETASRYLATLDSCPLGAFRTAVEAALVVAREAARPTAVSHLATLTDNVAGRSSTRNRYTHSEVEGEDCRPCR